MAQHAECKSRKNGEDKIRLPCYAKNVLLCYVIGPVATRRVFRCSRNQNRRNGGRENPHYHRSHS